MNRIEKIMAYEQGDLSDDETIDLFCELIKSGLAYSLQGHYGRTAHGLIQAGYIKPDGTRTDTVSE